MFLQLSHQFVLINEDDVTVTCYTITNGGNVYMLLNILPSFFSPFSLSLSEPGKSFLPVFLLPHLTSSLSLSPTTSVTSSQSCFLSIHLFYPPNLSVYHFSSSLSSLSLFLPFSISHHCRFTRAQSPGPDNVKGSTWLTWLRMWRVGVSARFGHLFKNTHSQKYLEKKKKKGSESGAEKSKRETAARVTAIKKSPKADVVKGCSPEVEGKPSSSSSSSRSRAGGERNDTGWITTCCHWLGVLQVMS